MIDHPRERLDRVSAAQRIESAQRRAGAGMDHGIRILAGAAVIQLDGAITQASQVSGVSRRIRSVGLGELGEPAAGREPYLAVAAEAKGVGHGQRPARGPHGHRHSLHRLEREAVERGQDQGGSRGQWCTTEPRQAGERSDLGEAAVHRAARDALGAAGVFRHGAAQSHALTNGAIKQSAGVVDENPFRTEWVGVGIAVFFLQEEARKALTAWEAGHHHPFHRDRLSLQGAYSPSALDRMDGRDQNQLVVVAHRHRQIGHHQSVVSGIGTAELNAEAGGVITLHDRVIHSPHRDRTAVAVAEHQGEAVAEAGPIGAELDLAIAAQGQCHRGTGGGGQGDAHAVAGLTRFRDRRAAAAGQHLQGGQGGGGDGEVVDRQSVVAAAVIGIRPAQPELGAGGKIEPLNGAGKEPAVHGEVAIEGAGAASGDRRAEGQGRHSAPAATAEVAAADPPVQADALGRGAAVAPLFTAEAEVDTIEARTGVVEQAQSPAEAAGDGIARTD